MLKAGLLTRSSRLPFPQRWRVAVVYRFSKELTAAGTVPVFHRSSLLIQTKCMEPKAMQRKAICFYLEFNLK